MEPERLLREKEEREKGEERQTYLKVGWMTAWMERKGRNGEWEKRWVQLKVGGWKKVDQKVRKSPVRLEKGFCVGVWLPIICECVCVCSKKVGGQTRIKGFATMNVILIKPSRILRFSLWDEERQEGKKNGRSKDKIENSKKVNEKNGGSHSRKKCYHSGWHIHTSAKTSPEKQDTILQRMWDVRQRGGKG